MLLLDGLDECGERRAVVADGIAAIAAGLPETTGIILATRDSAVRAATHLRMPEARLVEPAGLGAMLVRLLRHAAEHRVPEAERSQWASLREQRLRNLMEDRWRCRDDPPDVMSVPLFAVLLTLLIARSAPGGPWRLPAGRAQILAEAVRDTVDRWELTRLRDISDYRNVRGRSQLLDGYGEIAHAWICEPPGCSKHDASLQVEAMLRRQWGLAPGEARERVEDILWFWDEHVGVFLISEATGGVEPRSRLFAEIGEAMWQARHEDSAARRGWIHAAIRDGDSGDTGPVMLAAGLAASIAGELAEAALALDDPTERGRALIWATNAIADGAKPPEASLEALIDTLAQAASGSTAFDMDVTRTEAIRRGRVAPPSSAGIRPGWDYLRRLAMLSLPASMRPRREEALATLGLNAREQATIAARTALADAEADARESLAPAQEEAVRGFLVSTNGERGTDQQEVVERAVRYAAQLGTEAVETIVACAHGQLRLSGVRSSVRDTVAAFGYIAPELAPDQDVIREDPRFPSPEGEASRRLRRREDLEGWASFLTLTASLAPPRHLTRHERWRLPDIAALLDAIGADPPDSDAMTRVLASEEGELGVACVRAAALAAGLDLPAAAAQSAVVLEALSEGDWAAGEVAFAPSPWPPPRPDLSRLAEQHLNSLLEALGAESDWLFEAAFNVLVRARDPVTAQRAVARLLECKPARHPHAAIIATVSDPVPPEAAARLLAGNVPLLRMGAAEAARVLAETKDQELWEPRSR